MRKILVIIVSVLMLAIMGTFVITFYYNFSVGNRVGKVMKFSKKGYVIKTWEGQLFLGGIGGGDGEGGGASTLNMDPWVMFKASKMGGGSPLQWTKKPPKK